MMLSLLYLMEMGSLVENERLVTKKMTKIRISVTNFLFGDHWWLIYGLLLRDQIWSYSSFSCGH